MEIRIYFECLEQAYHYILPMIKKAIAESSSKNIPVRLVRNPSDSSMLAKGALYTIYSLTTPDFLISFCNEQKEIPIVAGEFSESVLTEDHELQRAIGAVASTLAGIIFLKISGSKPSERKHGGKKDFNPLTPAKILSQVYDYRGCIIGKWPTLENNKFVLKRDESFLSCPAKDSILLVEQTIVCAVREVIDNFEDVLGGYKSVAEVTIQKLSQTTEFKEFVAEVKNANTFPPILGIDEFIDDWKSRKEKSKRPRIVLDDEMLILKINRFSHAADPDRGMLIFSSFVLPVNTVLSRYIVKTDRIDDPHALVEGFAAQAIKEGLSHSLFRELERYAKGKLADHSVDITEFLKTTRNNWFGNNVLFSIFMFSNGMKIQDKSRVNAVHLRWDLKELFNVERKDFENSLVKFFNSRKYTAPLKIKKVKDKATEDEVTYIVVHQILEPNDFEVVSVSYPGAQGDLAILPERQKGRRQRRLYIDVVAWLPQTNFEESNELALEESKGSFNKRAIEKRIDKLDEFKKDVRMTKAITEALEKIGDKRKLSHIFIGVAFGLERKLLTRWQPAKVDFIVRVLKRRRWELAYFGKRLRYAFSEMEGEVNLPQIYEVIPSENTPNTSLLNFLFRNFALN